MTSELRETQHEMPTPAVAGWSEADRLAQVAAFRASIARAGGRITSEKRVRNIAFDQRGEKTTFRFVVEWSR